MRNLKQPANKKSRLNLKKLIIKYRLDKGIKRRPPHQCRSDQDHLEDMFSGAEFNVAEVTKNNDEILAIVKKVKKTQQKLSDAF